MLVYILILKPLKLPYTSSTIIIYVGLFYIVESDRIYSQLNTKMHPDSQGENSVP